MRDNRRRGGADIQMQKEKEIMSTLSEMVQEAKAYQDVLAETARLEAELKLARAQNPLTMLLEDAGSLLVTLKDATTNVETALHNEHYAKRIAKDAVQVYNDAENEYVMEIQFEGKTNAEQRKLATDVAIVKARQNGLGRPYAAMNKAKYAAEDAKMALGQAETRLSATRTAADLVAAMLGAAK